MSLPGLPKIDLDLSAFTPAQKMALQQLFLAIKKNDDTLAGLIGQGDISGFVPNLAIRSDASGTLTVSPTTTAELGYVHLVTSPIQTQINVVSGAITTETARALAAEALLAPLASPALTGSPTAPTQGAGDNSTKLATTAYVATAVGAISGTVMRGYIDGLGYTNSAAQTASFGAGQATDATNVLMISNGGAFTKTLAAWVAGTGNGGMGTVAAVAASTWYHCFLLSDSTGSTIDFGFDTSVTAAALLANANVVAAGLTLYRYISSIKTDAAKNLNGVTLLLQFGDTFTWKLPIEDVTSTAMSNTAATKTLASVPLGFRTLALLNVGCTVLGISDDYLDIYETALTDETITVQSAAHAGPSVLGAAGTLGAAAAPSPSDRQVLTDTTQGVRVRSTAGPSSNYNIWVRGFISQRGRNS